MNPILPASVAGTDLARRVQEAARRRGAREPGDARPARDEPEPPVEAVGPVEEARPLPPDETDGRDHGQPSGSRDDESLNDDRPRIDVLA